jgi:flagellar biosynthesis/type III secretory pathway protein FliH
MTGLIKSGSAALPLRVRALAPAMARAAPPRDPEFDRLEAEVAALADALAAREEELEALSAEARDAFARGEAEGREAGRAEAEDQGAATLAALEDAAERALAKFADELAGMETLAALLARTCLEKMLIASEDRTRLVCDLIRGQAAALGAGAVVELRVSAEDFATPDALDQAQAALGERGCKLSASDSLASGDCTLALRLGALEIGLDQQWGSLRAGLDAIVDGEASA